MSLRFWTDFADGSVMFPLGLAVGVLLLLFGHRRAAFAWTVSVGTVWAIMLVLKFVGYALAATVPHSPLHAIDLVTPSGHVASSTVVYGGMATLLLPGRGALRPGAFGIGLLVAFGIGLTRVLLDNHSTAEAVIGGLVGLGGLLLLARTMDAPIRGVARPVIILAAGLIMFVQHGTHLSWEEAIYHLSLQAVGWFQTVTR